MKGSLGTFLAWQQPASLLLPIPCLDCNICQAFGWGRSCGSRGEGLGWHEDPRQAGLGAAQPSVLGDERSSTDSEHCTFSLLEDMEDVRAGNSSGLADGHG